MPPANGDRRIRKVGRAGRDPSAGKTPHTGLPYAPSRGADARCGLGTDPERCSSWPFGGLTQAASAWPVLCSMGAGPRRSAVVKLERKACRKPWHIVVVRCPCLCASSAGTVTTLHVTARYDPFRPLDTGNFSQRALSRPRSFRTWSVPCCSWPHGQPQAQGCGRPGCRLPRCLAHGGSGPARGQRACPSGAGRSRAGRPGVRPGGSSREGCQNGSCGRPPDPVPGQADLGVLKAQGV